MNSYRGVARPPITASADHLPDSQMNQLYLNQGVVLISRVERCCRRLFTRRGDYYRFNSWLWLLSSRRPVPAARKHPFKQLLIYQLLVTSVSINVDFPGFCKPVCIGGISFGASLGWTSPVLPRLQNENSTSTFHLTTEEGSWVGSMLAIGCLSAALPAGYLADRLGPKKCVIGLAVPVIIFSMIVVFANDVYTLCIARFFSGVATGGVSVVAPMYISEIADVSLRGTLGSFFEFLIYTGVALTAIIGAYVDYITLTINFGGLALVLGVAFLFLPESPTYLIKTNKRVKAEAALKFYRSKAFNVVHAIDQIEEGILKRPRHSANIGKILSSKASIRGLVACVGLKSFQQLSGVDGITFYTVQILQAAGTKIEPYTSAIIVAVVQLSSASVLVFIVEKANRRVFLYMSAVGTCTCLAALGVYFQLKEQGVHFTGISALPLASLVFFMISFATGLGPIPWMVNGELFSPEIKGIANGITITTNYVLLFIVTKTLPVMMVEFPPYYTFYAYAVFMVLCIVFIKFYVPETRGKTLEQIQNELSA